MSEIADLTAELVRIDSVNPALIPGAAGEAELARFVARWLEEAGLEVEVEEVAPGRPNVVGVARGSGGGRTLLLNAHLDTVGVAGMDDPFSGRVADGRVHGRGSVDMKAGLAAIMLAGREARSRGLRGDVVVAAVVDEEVGSIGTEALLRRRTADAAIVTEPTSLDVAIAHKGFVAFELETEGRAAHGSRPDLGVDAIAKMGHVLVGIEALDRALRARAPHRLLGTGSIHASVIEGGQEFSSYPASCSLQAERRILPGETREQAEAELRSLLARLGESDADFRSSFRAAFWRDAFEISADAEIVRLVQDHAGTQLVGMSFWADSALLAGAGIPTVLFGPGGSGLHESEEWVDVAQAERCVEVLTQVAAELCA
jgi:acetylornithine deacetylase